jgi:hypothetical protein
MNNASSSRPRGRPRKVQAANSVVTTETVEAAAESFDNRPSLRAPMRDEDPRARAAARAAQIKGHLGSMDEGIDEFFIEPTVVPDGWTYEWKRKTVMGAEDPSYQVSLARMGWEPVPAGRHPEMMPAGMSKADIERKGMILMERPKEITDEARAIEHRRAREQVYVKEQQLSNAPEGTLTRDHAQARPNIKKSYSPVSIPKE